MLYHADHLRPVYNIIKWNKTQWNHLHIFLIVLYTELYGSSKMYAATHFIRLILKNYCENARLAIVYCVLFRKSTCPWWRHPMETFSALLALLEGNSPVTGECPSQRPVSRNFAVFFDLCLNKYFKQFRRWWFEMPSCPLWRHCYTLAAAVGLVAIGMSAG